MEPAAAVTILAAVIIVAALAVYLVAIIGALRQITADLDLVIAAVLEIVRKTGPVNAVVLTLNKHLDAGVDLLEGLLVKKAGLEPALSVVDGLYPGAGAAGFRRFSRSRSFTRGAPAAAAAPAAAPAPAPPAPEPAAVAEEAPPAAPARMSVVTKRPWETGVVSPGPRGVAHRSTEPSSMEAAAPAAAGTPGRLSVVTRRPWE